MANWYGKGTQTGSNASTISTAPNSLSRGIRFVSSNETTQAHRFGLEPGARIIEVHDGAIFHLVPLVHEISLSRGAHAKQASVHVNRCILKTTS